MDKETIMANTERRVDELLESYRLYTTTSTEIEKIKNRKMRNAVEISKAQNKPITEVLKDEKSYEQLASLEMEKEELETRLQSISDSMTFDNPIVWMMYKYKAYQRPIGSLITISRPILTLRDLKAHCEPKDYICTKRFVFLNRYLNEERGIDLMNRDMFSDDTPLPKIYEDDIILSLSLDERFMRQWKSYEYFEIDGKPAKWQNYRL